MYPPHTSEFFTYLLPAYIENWPAPLHSLSLRQIDIPLSVEDHKALLILHDEGDADITPLIARIDEHLGVFPDGFFPRLGSRSPKDTMHSFGNDEWPRHRTGKQVIDSMLGSMRVWHDLQIATQHSYQPHLFLREWKAIPEWAEFRCFIRDGTLIGMSQYQYHEGKAFPELLADRCCFESMIRSFITDKVIPELHVPSIVVDVFLDIATTGSDRSVEVKLLEINPFFQMTDACLYSWDNGGDFDGKLRILERAE